MDGWVFTIGDVNQLILQLDRMAFGYVCFWNGILISRKNFFNIIWHLKNFIIYGFRQFYDHTLIRQTSFKCLPDVLTIFRLFCKRYYANWNKSDWFSRHFWTVILSLWQKSCELDMFIDEVPNVVRFCVCFQFRLNSPSKSSHMIMYVYWNEINTDWPLAKCLCVADSLINICETKKFCLIIKFLHAFFFPFLINIPKIPAI